MNNIFIEVPSFAQILDFVGSFAFAISAASFIGKSKLAIIATIQIPVTASLNTNFNTDGSCATASGWRV